LTSAPACPARTTYIHEDLRDPEKILGSPVVRETPDFSQPIALMLVAILHFISDDDDPAGIVATLLSALPPGSYLVSSHVTAELDPDGIHGMERAYRNGGLWAGA
jgi:S-adenosyl methyltransferase